MTTERPSLTAAPVDDRLTGLGAMAQQMFARARLSDTLEMVMGLALQSFRCTAVGAMLVTIDSGVVAAAATDSRAARADQQQVDDRQGPGLQAIARSQPVLVDELRFDSRWRFWSPVAADLGFRSVLSLSLVDGDTSGALNLYSRQPSWFGSEDLGYAHAFAQHASIAVAVAEERQLLLSTADSRGVVGQAQGILMERHGISADQAFLVLRHYASHLNQKLRATADLVVRKRDLPDLDLALAAG